MPSRYACAYFLMTSLAWPRGIDAARDATCVLRPVCAYRLCYTEL
jgi:hypothetical protein